MATLDRLHRSLYQPQPSTAITNHAPTTANEDAYIERTNNTNNDSISKSNFLHPLSQLFQ